MIATSAAFLLRPVWLEGAFRAGVDEAAVADVEVVAQAGHVGGVSRAAFFPGGETLITTGWNGELRVWDAANGSLIGLYRGHEHSVSAIAVSPSGTRFASGDREGNLLLWSVGEAHAKPLWTHRHPVRNVAFTDEDTVVSLATGGDERSLVSHDLMQNERRELALPAGSSTADVMTFVGSRHLLVGHRQEVDNRRPWRVGLFDLRSGTAVADFRESTGFDGVHSFAEAIAEGYAPLPWGPAGFLVVDPVIGPNLLGGDLLTGDFVDMIFCSANYCLRSTIDILAIDEATRRVAFVTDSGNFLKEAFGRHGSVDTYYEYADVVLVATLPPIDRIVESALVRARDTGQQKEDPGAPSGGEVAHRELVIGYESIFEDDPSPPPLLFSDVQAILDLRREVPYTSTIAGRTAPPPRNRTDHGGLGAVPRLPEDLVGSLELGIPAQSSHSFVLENEYQFGSLLIKERESHVQGLGAYSAHDSCSGSGNYCAYGTVVAAMSADARWVAGSTSGEFATSLWLWHDTGSVSAAQSALRRLGYLADEVAGMDVESGYLMIGDVDEPHVSGTVALDGWYVDGEWRDAMPGALQNPYDIGGATWRIDRDEDGRWSDWDGPVSVRKTRLARTVEALLRFQGDRALAATGVLDTRTRAELGIPEMATPEAGQGRWLWYHLPRALRDTHFSGGIAFAPDGSRMAFGRGPGAYALDLGTAEVEEIVSIGAGAVESVGFASSDELLVVHAFGVVAVDLASGIRSASSIGALSAIDEIRAYRGGDLIRLDGGETIVLAQRSASGQPFEELVRIRRKSGDEWVAVTPAGFFAGTETLSRGVYLRMGGARVQALDQFYGALYRPDLVRERLAGDPQGLYAKAAARMNAGRLAAEGPPPSVTIRWPQPGHEADRPDLRIAVDMEDEGGGIGRVEWRVNGAVVGLGASERGLAPVRPRLERSVALVPGANRIEVVAYNAAGGIGSMPAVVDVEYIGDPRKPRLFVLAAGVEQYRDKDLRLEFAADDAKSIADTMARRAESLFDGVSTHVLLDGEVTRDGLSAAFEALGSQVRAEDVFMFFLAGHGVTVDGRYHFLPADFRYRNDGSFRESAVSEQHMQRWLSGIAAQKSLVLLDTCNSGAYVEAQLASRGLAGKTAIDKLIRATGRATISASSGSEVALEGVGGHGVLTYALLEGFAKGDRRSGNRDGWVSTLELASFIGEEVPQLTMRRFGYEQVPQYNLHGADFPLAKAR